MIRLGCTGRPSRFGSAVGVVFCLVAMSLLAQMIPDFMYKIQFLSPQGLFGLTCLGALVLGFGGLLYYMATSYLVAGHCARDGNLSSRTHPIPCGNNQNQLQREHSGLIASLGMLVPTLLLTSASWGMLEVLADQSLKFSERILFGCIWMAITALALLLWRLTLRMTMRYINGLSIRVITPTTSITPGGSVLIHIESRRKIAADAISLWLVCEERAARTVSKYEGNAFPREEVLTQPLEEATPLSGNNSELYRRTLEIPADAMHSLELQHNGIFWLLKMELHKGKHTIYKNRFYLAVAPR